MVVVGWFLCCPPVFFFFWKKGFFPHTRLTPKTKYATYSKNKIRDLRQKQNTRLTPKTKYATYATIELRFPPTALVPSIDVVESFVSAFPPFTRSSPSADLPCGWLCTSGMEAVYLALVGDGPLAGRMAALHGAHTRVYCVPEFLPHSKLAALYAACDAHVSASVFETFGNTVLEAQASGTPVVVPDAQGFRYVSDRALLHRLVFAFLTQMSALRSVQDQCSTAVGSPPPAVSYRPTVQPRSAALHPLSSVPRVNAAVAVGVCPAALPWPVRRNAQSAPPLLSLGKAIGPPDASHRAARADRPFQCAAIMTRHIPMAHALRNPCFFAPLADPPPPRRLPCSRGSGLLVFHPLLIRPLIDPATY